MNGDRRYGVYETPVKSLIVSVFDGRAALRRFGIGRKLFWGAPGIATRSKNATMGSWPYY